MERGGGRTLDRLYVIYPGEKRFPLHEQVEALGFRRALAEAGVGEREEALWSLGITARLDAAFATAPFDAFGEAGARLGRWRRAELDPLAGAVRFDTPGLVPPALLESLRAGSEP